MSDWLVWPLGIGLWLVLGVALFIWRELPGLKGEPDRVTLSRWVWTVSTKFPLFAVWLYLNIGMLIGGLSVHFYWHWCPAPAVSTGYYYPQPSFGGGKSWTQTQSNQASFARPASF